MTEQVPLITQNEDLVSIQQKFIGLITLDDKRAMLNKFPDILKGFDFAALDKEWLYQQLEESVNSYYIALLSNINTSQLNEQELETIKGLTALDSKTLVSNARAIKYILISDPRERSAERAHDQGYHGCHW